MKHGSLFSGIGGFDLAAQWMGWENVFHCEWNEFCQKVLKHHFPNAESYGDITKTDFTKYAGTIDVLSGGFPCQPFSQAGKRKGTNDNRHLWPEMFRAVREIRPRWIVGENVSGIITTQRGLVFRTLQADLANEGYKVFPTVLPACAKGGLHRRDRAWFIAYSDSERCAGEFAGISKEIRPLEKSTQTLAAHQIRNRFKNKLPEPLVIGRIDGLPVELDGITFSKWREQSTRSYGNAIVPQVAHEIFKAIQAYEKLIYANTFNRKTKHQSSH
jgi:DNA (cytosine-5)-methyltransferase 1